MSKGLICQSSSPVAARALFARTPDGGLRFGIQYRYINSKAMKNWYPFPLIRETLNIHQGATIYTKLDVRGAYNLLRVKEGDEHELAIRTTYGLFEPTVMQFGIMNAAADFQGDLNNTIREVLDDFTSAYLDDILIYSNLEEEHVEHVKWVMQHLLVASLYLKPEKCEFHKETARYLGLSISTDGISTDEDKVGMVQNWSRGKRTKNGRLNNPIEVQQFLRFCNYY